jgi:AbrB family looped-hinge helix DNA binding protein
MDHVTITLDGQIALPKGLIEALHLDEGSQLTVELHGQQIVLTKEAGNIVRDSVRQPDFRTHLLGGPKVEDFVIERTGAVSRPS